MTCSLQLALADKALSENELKKRFGPYLAIAAQLLGSPPSFPAFVHTSDFTISIFFGLFRSCFRIPSCDLGFGRLSAPQRRLALLESSLQQGCMYCVTHCAVMGDVLRGSKPNQCVMEGGLENAREESTTDRLLKKIVREACQIPSAIEESTKKEFLKVFGEQGYFELASMLCFMGWLNWMMDAFGMRIESVMVPFAEATLKDASVEYVTDGAVAEDGQRGVGEKQLERALTPSVWDRLAAYLQNAAGLVALVKHAVTAGYQEMVWFRGIPKNNDELDLLTATQLGYLPKFVAAVQDAVLKRALVYGLRESLFRDSLTTWTRREKFIFIYIFSKGVRYGVLEEDSIRLIELMDLDGGAESVLQNFKGAGELLNSNVALAGEPTRILTRIKDVSQPPYNKFSAACESVHACAGPSNGLTESITANLLTFVPEPKDVSDLAGQIALCGFLHRAVVFCC